jgi:alkylated DNA repair dioxygenase AlkB
MNKVLTPARGAIAAALVAGLALPLTAQGQLRQALETGEQATRRAEQVQEQINQLDDQRSDAVSEFRTLLQRTQAAQLYARQQEKVVESQRRELESLEEQLGRVDEITAQTTPMLLDMIADLEAFVQADLPFRTEDRTERIENLRTAMENAQVPIVEQYRLIIEAYKSEMEYGRTIDTWPEDIQIEDKTVTVDMFLYGRVALVYMSPDRRYAARYDRAQAQWVPVENQFKENIAKAIKVAKGTTTPSVLYAPATRLDVQL